MSRNKKALVPRYRFPEFRDSGEWEEKPLSELLTETKTRNRDLKFSREQVLSVSGDYGCVNQIELLGRSYAGASVKDYHVVETGDIVYTKSPLKQNPFGIIKENKGKPGIVSTLYAVYRPTDKGNSTYLDFYFSNDYNLNSYLQPIVRKGAKNDMKVNNFAVLGGEIVVPDPSEQQKIADCLTSLDELISVEANKLEAYNSHKKGLMQKLFPAEGKTVPELRFPEFRGQGEWSSKSMIDIAEEKLTNGVFNDPKKVGSGYKLINVLDMYYNTTIDEKKLSLLDISKNEFEKNKVEYGDIFFTRSSLVKEGIAQSNIYLGSSDDVTFDGHVIRLRPNQKLIFPLFLHYVLKTNLVRFQLISKAKTATMTTIGQSEVSSTKFRLPSIPEQQIIADCLSSLDDHITVQSKKIQALKTHKKSLMQGLFPSVDEAGE